MGGKPFFAEHDEEEDWEQYNPADWDNAGTPNATAFTPGTPRRAVGSSSHPGYAPKPATPQKRRHGPAGILLGTWRHSGKTNKEESNTSPW